MAKKLNARVLIVLIFIITVLLFNTRTCYFYTILAKSPMEYNYEVIKATMDEVPGNIQTAIKIENLETGPGVFVVEQVIRSRSQGTLRRTSTMSLVPGQPKSFYQIFNVDADDVLDLSYRVIAPKKAVLVPTYKYMACGYLP